jgi:ribosomal protein L11 methyltransferase
MHIVVARLACDERTARSLATALDETLDPDDTACAAFEDESGNWHVAIHFRAPPDEAAVRALVRLSAGETAAAALAFAPLADADWVAQSLAGLPPVRAGRFIVHGAHDRPRVPVNALSIEIEAALAFGTGHHGTTRGCLLALDALAKRERRAPSPSPARKRKKILDIGTGSGVLAIAAAKRLHARITASDIDRQAVDAARANVNLNSARDVRTVRAAGALVRAVTAGAPYDLIFANILLAPLMRLAAPIRRLAAPRARIVLSGLLPNQTNAILAIYAAQGLRLERRLTLEGWATLVLRR